MKISLTIAGALLLGTTLTACSGSDGASDGGDGDSAAYCKDIASAKPVFETLASGDLSKLEEGFKTFHQLADEAPGDVSDDWKKLDGTARSVEEKLKATGLKYSDLPAVSSGSIPEGVDITKLTSFVADLQKLNNDDVSDARTAIAEHAKKSCDVELGSL